MSLQRAVARTGLALAGCALASPAFALDLLAAYKLARDNDAQFAAAQAEYRAAQEAVPQARAAVLPQVGVTGSASKNDPEQGDNYQREEFELRLTQTLFAWADFAGLDRADARLAQAEANFAAAKQELILRVARAYFDVLTARDRVRFAEAEQEAINRQLEQAQKRFDVGLIPITDVKSARASYDLAVSRAIEARNALENAREALRTVITRTPGELAGITDELPLKEPESPVEQWVERALEQNPDYLAARAAAEAARHGMRVQRAERYPQVDLFVSHSQSDSDRQIGGGLGATRGERDTDRIGIQLNWNLYQGGAISSRTDEARARFQAEQARVVRNRRATQQSTRNNYRNLEATMSQVRALREAVESNRAALEAERAGFQVGTRTAVDVLAVVRDLYGAQRDFAEARSNYITTRLELKQAAGTLTMQDVRRVNSWLEEPPLDDAASE
jgi:outer membrane protein